MKRILFFFVFLGNISIFPNSSPYTLDYIYVNANTGQSSGGHSAIRLGDLVYHFQYFPDKIFHIVREPWKNFHYVYGIQENRTIFIRKISLSKSNYDFFLSQMNEIYLIQKKELDNLAKLKDDLIILDSVVNGDKSLHLKAGGYFVNKKADPLVYSHLSNRIEKEFGKNYILKKLIETRSKLYSFEFNKKQLPDLIFTSKTYPQTVENFSSNYIETLSLLKFFSSLQDETQLNLESIIEFKEINYSLDLEQVKVLVSHLEILEGEMISLLNSKSNNKGYPLLVNLARYLVIQKSIADKKMYFLDSFGKNQLLVFGEVLNRKKYLEKINQQLSKTLEEMYKSYFFKKESISINYNLLEDRVNRKQEVLLALNHAKPIRVNFELMIPSKEEDITIDFAQKTKDELKINLEKAKENYQKYELFLQNKYSFNLIQKNCTTEIFHSINSFFEKEKESYEKLGGVIRGNDTLVFIPFYAYYAVKNNYNVVEEEYVPSLRTKILSQNLDKGILFSIKESSTISSEYYKFNPEDSWFLFFTEDVFWKRPIYGLVNLLVGFSELGYGIVLSPFDKGEKTIKGLQGIFFSAPEILFFNIRKGTFIYELDSEWQER